MQFDLPTLHDAIAAAQPQRECVVGWQRRLTWGEVADRTHAFAGVLAAYGLGRGGDDGHPRWSSPHDHVALYLSNCHEYLEGVLGAHRARCAPFNVNHRYVAEELERLFRDARPAAIVHHARFGPTLAEVLRRLGGQPLLLRVDDGSGTPPLDGARDYEDELTAHAAPRAALACSPDDLHITYTGGTTGAPKGVLWRQGDLIETALRLRQRDGTSFASVAGVVEQARQGPGAKARLLPAVPLMHGAGLWNALSTWLHGGTVVLDDGGERYDPAAVVELCRREAVTAVLIVGEAMARPLADELESSGAELPQLEYVLNSGAVLGAAGKARLEALLPQVRIADFLGGTETGSQAIRVGSKSGTFRPSRTLAVLSEDRSRRLQPGDPELGWVAQGGRVPLGYLNDPARTARAFPTVEGVRYAVSGDRAQLLADSQLTLRGRDSTTVNTGGEKVFAEEVEEALNALDAIADALVVGAPSARWGEEVVAVVQLAADAAASDEQLRDACRGRLAGYKLPKRFVRVDAVRRLANGKPDYVWAKQLAQAPSEPAAGRSL